VVRKICDNSDILVQRFPAVGLGLLFTHHLGYTDIRWVIWIIFHIISSVYQIFTDYINVRSEISAASG
jgi:hypothetical protein